MKTAPNLLAIHHIFSRDGNNLICVHSVTGHVHDLAYQTAGKRGLSTAMVGGNMLGSTYPLRGVIISLVINSLIAAAVAAAAADTHKICIQHAFTHSKADTMILWCGFKNEMHISQKD